MNRQDRHQAFIDEMRKPLIDYENRRRKPARNAVYRKAISNSISNSAPGSARTASTDNHHSIEDELAAQFDALFGNLDDDTE